MSAFSTYKLSIGSTVYPGTYNSLMDELDARLPAAVAPLASPTLTGTPAAPTAAVDTNTTQLATTAFVLAQAASAAEVEAASSTSKFVTPARQQRHPSATKGAVSFNGTNGSIYGSYNVTSVTRNGSGDYSVNHTTAFSDANYQFQITCVDNGAGTPLAAVPSTDSNSARSTTVHRFLLVKRADGTVYDPQVVNTQYTGDQ
jgi:hypothetical protein